MDLIPLVLSVVLALVIATTAATIKREHARVRAVNFRVHELGHYEIAYLAGGPRRVANTAIALLAKSGGLRVSRGGNLHAVAGARASHPVEEAVLAAVAAGSKGVSAPVIRREIGGGVAMDEIRHHLTGLGLLVPGETLVPVQTLLRRLRLLSWLALAGAALSVAAVIFLSMGPFTFVGGLVFAFTGAAGLIAVARHQRAMRDALSSAGHDELRRARQAWAPMGSASSGGEALSLSVALYGIGELHDPSLEAELNAHEADEGSGCAAGVCGGGNPGSSGAFGAGGDFGSGGDSGLSGCGGSSGCGGGGCGGGGCGGG
ncbi:TIGR04222 domain-containing membrane protein [Nonomuraea sp. NPDC050022]|uniref:TIGR04222 domain-containing membrane protein n=1 Tax=Nonomuraea sp. NPDC050022 TaxID=3364358 RepID=UPI0037B69C6F